MADTRTRLIQTAAKLFRQKGYHGTGMAEILTLAQAPKGSLYHHFPNGKPDLAKASAEWASDGMKQIIDDSFLPAADWLAGATTLCHKLAKFFDLSGGWDGCPISSVLFDGPQNDDFRALANRILEDWSNHLAGHGARLGLKHPKPQAETLLLLIQGAWVMCRAQNNSDVLRGLPARLG